MVNKGMEKDKPKTKVVRWMKEILTFTLIVTVLSLAIDAWRSREMPSTNMPSLSMSTLEGDWVDIKKMSQDKPILLYFWATWCSVCNFVSPSVNWLSESHQVISVALSSGDDRRLGQFMAYKEYDFPVINDPKGNIGQTWNITVIPSIFIVKNGEISSITTGFTTPMGMWLRLYFS
ncbi:thioredoxin family protein [Psychromonas ingrahamii 37]|uniref:Thioredoxin family protein n=1 Tax=Psychromonas ingrahamii (strain DSM 17664 / CCUG 51855 / 37) TaxID=357804 RepID=A1SUN3_PSYIN|nr:protein disulfide oxidoreductase [Psychromonas ingrahamii]ABM03198.1 thioredoxin family protein [Psychromonas ingrahamii 37]